MAGSFSGNVINTSIMQFFILLLSMITSIIFSRTLGPEGTGVYGMVSFFASILVYFSTFGLTQATVYYIGKKKYSNQEIFGHCLIYSLALSIGVTIIGLLVINLFGERLFPEISTHLLSFGLLLVYGQLLYGFIVQVLLGLQKITSYNNLTFLRVAATLIVVCILLFISRLDVKTVIFTDIIIYLLLGILVFFIAYSSVGGIKIKLNLRLFSDSLKYGLPVYLGSILNFIHYRADIFLINQYLDPVMVGFYVVSTGLSEKLSLISNGISTVLFPRISSENDQSVVKSFTPLVLRSTLIIIIIAAFVLGLMAPWLITIIYSQSFVNSVRPFQYLLPGAIFLGGWSVLDSDFKGRGKPIWSSVTTCLAVVANIFLNLYWIPKYGIEGAAFASSFSYTLAFIFALTIYCRLSGNSFKEVVIPKRSDYNLYKQLIVDMAKALAKKI